MKTCYIVESGWILIGDKNNEDTELIYLTDGAIVRSWSNGRGIGAIASETYKGDYIYDLIGGVNIRKQKILFEIPCNWSNYTNS